MRTIKGGIRASSIGLLTLLTSLAISTESAKAQITIGSAEEPVLGALLDLKEAGTTQKGLILPRVILTHLKVPNNSTDLSLTIQDAKDSPWDKDSHTGLMVYHVGDYDFCDPRTFHQGVYIWDSNQWQYLGSNDSQISNINIGIFTDNRNGEKYPFLKFGEAGVWMLENMRYIDPEMTAGKGSLDPSQKHYTYPNSNLSQPDIAPDTWYPAQGLLYSFTAATIGTDPTYFNDKNTGQNDTDEMVDTTGKPTMHIKGVCPEGWHLPSDREWNLLEKEIYNRAPKYSDYTTENGFPFNPEWNSAWEFTDFEGENSGIGQRGSDTGISSEGHGKALISKCALPGTPPTTINGRSLPRTLGGFDALLTGVIIKGQHFVDQTKGLSSYNHATYFWTSSTAVISEEVAGMEISGKYFRQIYVDGYDGGTSQTVTRSISFAENASMLSVRCVRD